MAKIGALLIRRARFQESFAVSHTSTFAEDDWSSCLALKALEVLERDRLIERCASTGNTFLAELRELQSRYPDEIREVRGRGLMVGVELADQGASSSLGVGQGRIGDLDLHVGDVARGVLPGRSGRRHALLPAGKG